ncbi:carbohydrate kinase family protein [bacterium]|nr:carbohydrate kinase family protein [bacterium]
MIDVLTIGDSSIDLYMKIAEDSVVSEDTKICFYHGSKIPVDHFETSIAGNAINVAVGCTSFGLKTMIYTEIGNDSGADRIVSELNALGIDTTYCNKNPGIDTNLHSIVVAAGERTIFSHHGPKDYEIKDWEVPKWIYYTSLGEGFEKFQAELVSYLEQNEGVGTAFNPGTFQMRAGVEHLQNILNVVDILFVNREEAERLTDTKNLEIEELHTKLQELGPKLTVITEGKEGASAHDGKKLEKIHAISDNRPIVDKTGAGDAFSSGFLSAIVCGKSLQEALNWGSINAGNVIKEIGSIKGLATREDVLQ